MTMHPPINKNTSAVVVLYHPDDSAVDNISGYQHWVDIIYVIDNTPEGVTNLFLYKLTKIKSLQYIRIGENVGIAAALNCGVKKAQDAGYQWVATFDQDSAVTDGYFSAMEDAFRAVLDKECIAIISPVYVEHSYANQVTYAPSEPFCFVESTMTSGNIVNIDAWGKVGGFDNELFIDYVDHDFCLKCGDKGYKIVQANHALLKHSLGAFSEEKFIYRNFKVTNHNFIRRYYNARNRIVIYKRYYSSHRQWIVYDFKSFLKELVKLILLEKDPLRKMWYVTRGLLDGFRGRLGKIS